MTISSYPIIDYHLRLELAASVLCHVDDLVKESIEAKIRQRIMAFNEAIYAENIIRMYALARREPLVLCRGASDKRLPMDHIVQHRNEQLIIEALKLGVDPDIADEPDLHLVHVLARLGYIKALCCAILCRQVDINVTVAHGKYKGWKPIDFAITYHQGKMVKYIMDISRQRVV
ncbi:MAG: hypothetical protein HY860_01175 [Chlamydiales bacterium]|nr:hypothetical protein [Chlamydiales bacterium]